MSTSSGVTSKGEKGKQKFQSLDILNLFRVSRGEPSEKQQQKSTHTLKHGMQSLGKVPSARRPPANLPSLKSEHSGNDSAVSLVPSGGPGWAKQETTATTSPSSTTLTNTNATNSNSGNTQISSHQAAIALPVTTTIPPQNKHSSNTSATPVATDKSWSAVMSGTDGHPPPYQSPQFQHEFPSLSVGDGGATRTGGDTQYGPGPSLRPQTEGSWIQGGSRTSNEPPVRNSSAPLGAPPQLSAQAGLPNATQPPQFRGFLPPFMYARGNFPPNSSGLSEQALSNITATATSTLPSNNTANGRNHRSDARNSNRNEIDDLAHRPIIKEEDLNRMDDMTRDMGWASHDDIDYNQKLAFSDDEAPSDRQIKKDKVTIKEPEKTEPLLKENQHSYPENDPKLWNTTQSRRSTEEEELNARRRQQRAEVIEAVERAKQRKEQEEKKYLEVKQNAAKKLQELDERKNKIKRENEQEDTQGTINPMVVPPHPITPAPIPVPDWEKDKSKSDYQDDKHGSQKQTLKDSGFDFKQMTQIEGKSFPRKDSRGFDRERDRASRDQNGPNFSKQYQNDLPPRFQRQFRNNANSSPQPAPFPLQYDMRWGQNTSNIVKNTPQSGRKNRDIDPLDRDDDRRDYKRQGSDDSYRNSNRSYPVDSGRKSSEMRYKEEDEREYNRTQDYEYKRDRDEEKWEKEKYDKGKDSYDGTGMSRQSSDEWHDRRPKFGRDDKPSDRYERPQRPDSRDSRTSKESRHSRDSARDSESRDYMGSWADSSYETAFEDKKKDHFKEDRRQVPGPITKERIEADDLKSEKRNLTQLKRGQIPEKKVEIKEEEKISEKEIEDVWNLRKNKDIIDEIAEIQGSLLDIKYKPDIKANETDQKKTESKFDKDDKNRLASNRRVDGQSNRNQGWGGNSRLVVRNWNNKRSSGNNGGRPRYGGPPRPSSAKSGEFHGTDSEISADEMPVALDSNKDDHNMRSAQKSPKTGRKFDKEEIDKDFKQDKFIEAKPDNKQIDMNRRDYIAKGEPSRHGRGGSSFRGSGRGGGLSKRIDGYGPPPSKSPFGHHEEKDFKKSSEEMAEVISSDEKSKQVFPPRKESNQNQTNSKKLEDKFDRNKQRRGPESRRGKSKNKDENGDSGSEHSDESAKGDKSRKGINIPKSQTNNGRSNNQSSSNSLRRNNPPRIGNDNKRGYGPISRTDSLNVRQNSSGSIRTNQGRKDGSKDDKLNDPNFLTNAIADISLKNEEMENIDGDIEEKNSVHGDTDGFQEVKSKKNVKDQRHKGEEKPISKTQNNKNEKELLNKERDRKGKVGSTSQLSQQQIANIPSLMATPVNPPPVITQNPNKNQFGPRINKLPPRLAKQRENNRLQKQQLQQNIGDVNDLNKVNQNLTAYCMKEGTNSLPVTNAWEKPLNVHARGSLDQESMLGIGLEPGKAIEAQSTNQSQNNPTADKVIGKGNQIQDNAVLDGTTPPVVETIIFENTNFKSAPGTRAPRNDKSRKMDDSGPMENSVMSGLNKPFTDLLNKNDKQADIRMQLAFNKEDGSDIKLDFMESEISYLTEDKSSKNIGLPRSMHAITSSNNTISPSTADALNFKIACVKKVWEMPTVIEHNVGQDDGTGFATSFVPDPNSLDPSGPFNKGTDTPEDNNEGYSPTPNQVANNSSTNVCKVKPTQQVSVSSGQTVLNAGNHQQHSALVGAPGLMTLSPPPPMQPVIGAGVGLGQPPQQFTANQHAIGYQAGLGGNTQYGMPAIPSPPTVLFNSTQQLQGPTAGLYGTFQIDQSQVLGGQGRSQFSQYPNHFGLGQTASSPYSQSMYLPTQPHPPTAQAPPDIYQSMSSYRLPNAAPFGQNQQLNNQSTVLISSTSNSLMSATVKPSSQQISAIGTKAGGVGQAYQQQSQQGQQLYMTYDPATLQANYLPNTGVMQRGPAGPVQNNVVPGLQPSSSYYSGSTGCSPLPKHLQRQLLWRDLQSSVSSERRRHGGNQTGYFQQPGSSTLQSAPLQQHQTGYSLQGSVFGTHNQSHTSAGLQYNNSHFLSTPMQLAAITQQYRSQNLPNTYMKTVGNQQIGDQSGRSQQLKSPGSQQEVLSSVFTSGPQIPSPKSRQNCKQPQPQPSPTAQTKYNLYQVGNQQSGQGRSYPAPIQRPVNSQQYLGSLSNNGNQNNQKHRSNNPNNRSGAPSRQYYGNQGAGSLSNQNDKTDDGKLNDSGNQNSTNTANPTTGNNTPKSSGGVNSNLVSNQTSDLKDKEESSALKD